MDVSDLDPADVVRALWHASVPAVLLRDGKAYQDPLRDEEVDAALSKPYISRVSRRPINTLMGPVLKPWGYDLINGEGAMKRVLDAMRAPKPVMLESPYSGDVETNVAYALECMRHSISLNEAPLGTHLLYTQLAKGGFLPDGVAHPKRMCERDTGLACGQAWRSLATKTVLYCDRGVSSGMERARAEAVAMGQTVEVRFIHAIAT